MEEFQKYLVRFIGALNQQMKWTDEEKLLILVIVNTKEKLHKMVQLIRENLVGEELQMCKQEFIHTLQMRLGITQNNTN